MSIIHTFDDRTEEIVKPCYVSKKVKDFPETVIVTFNEKIINLVKSMPGAVQISDMYAGFPIPIYKIHHKGKSVAVYQTILGGAGSAGLLEEVIEKGGRKFLFFGSCGTLDKQVAAGNFIIPTAAYRDEGTSYHYAPTSDYIEVVTSSKLASLFKKLTIPFIEGKTWTTDAFYRETQKNMMLRKEEGCITVEMECASIMAVGQFRNIEVYEFLYGEDTLDGIEWDPRTMGRVQKNSFENYLQTALELAVRL